jgi:protein TonB
MQAAPVSHPNPLEEPEHLAKPLTVSIVFHAALVGALLVTAIINANRKPFMGVERPGAGVAVNAVKTIPIVRKEGRTNPLANDTTSIVPQQPLVKLSEQHPLTAPPENAIPLATEKPVKQKPPKPEKLKDIDPPRPRDRQAAQFRPHEDYHPNQVYSRTPQALSSEQMGLTGAGGVGIGPNSPFGYQFGGYAQHIHDIIASKWNQAGISARPDQIASVTIQIERNGSARVTDVQTSGSYSLDTSARRAILDANPLPPLPANFPRQNAVVELLFQIKP